MSSIINPFIKGGFSPILSSSLESRIFSPLTYEGGAVEIYGERGTGKSEVLKYITNPSQSWIKHFKDHVFVYLNCQDSVIPPVSSTFWNQIIKQLARKVDEGTIQEKCHSLLKKPNEEVEIDHNDFHEVLDIAGEKLKKIVLVLDDFNVLIRVDPENLNSTRGFLQGLRSLTTRDFTKANLVVSTRYPLYESCKPLALPNYSPFDNGFSLCRLRSFQEKELLLLLERAVMAGQTPFSSAERNYVAYLSGFHPQLAQIVAAQIFDYRINMSAPLSDLSPIGERFKREARPIFESLFWSASEIERFLLMLVSLQSLKGKLTSTNYDIADLVKIFSEREREMNDLTERGLLNRVQANPPQWDLFSPVFQWWILKEIEAEEPAQLGERRKIWGSFLTQRRADQAGQLIDFVRKNRDTIEKLGRSALSLTGWQMPKLPGF